jgi:excisionase family DNA binding protein
MDNILTVPQVAEYLQISKSKLYLMIRRGEIPHVKIGKNVRIFESDLIEWLEKNRMPQQQLPFGFLEEI